MPKKPRELPTGVRRRKGTYRIIYRSPTGKQVEESAGTDLRAAVRLRKRRLTEILHGTWVHPSLEREDARAGRLTVAEFVEAWNTRRRNRRNAPRTHKDDASRLRDHVVPELGECALSDLTVRDVRRLLRKLDTKTSETTGKKLSPNTIANVFGTLSKMLSDAERDLRTRGIDFTSPCALLDDDEKPKRVARPRDYYRRGDVEALISDPRVPDDRRAFWALLFLTGMRHDEAAGLRWRDIEDAQPLPRIELTGQAGGRPLKEDRRNEGKRRVVPVHPTLSRVLGSWRRVGFPALYGRFPRPGDYLVPSPVDVDAYRPKRSSLKQIERDAKAIDVKPRTVHETRNTFLTLASEDAPELEHVIRQITHSAKVGGASETYMRTRYLAKCEAMQRFDIRIERGAEVVALEVSGAGPIAGPLLAHEKSAPKGADFIRVSGGADGTRTRGLRRDRPAL